LLHAPLTLEISTLSLHDALPILIFTPEGRIPTGLHFRLVVTEEGLVVFDPEKADGPFPAGLTADDVAGLVRSLRVQYGIADDKRSEEHTSELQSRENLVCRLLLE